MFSSTYSNSLRRYPLHIKQYIIKKVFQQTDTVNKDQVIPFLLSKNTISSAEEFDNYIASNPILTNEELDQAKTATRQLGINFYYFRHTRHQSQSSNMEQDNINNNPTQLPQQISNNDLAQLLATLLQQQNNQTLSSQPSRVQLPLPPTYDGTREIIIIDNWISSVTRYLSFNQFPEQRWVHYGVGLLVDRALLWWNRISTTTNLTNWDSFVAALNTAFRPQLEMRSARDRLFAIHQTQSISLYIRQFQDILLELNITDDEAKDKFIRGLKDEPRRYTLLENPLTLEDAYICAMSFETASNVRFPSTSQSLSNTSAMIDEPMDLSVLRQQNQLLLNLINQQRSFPTTCYYCNKNGHIKRDCRKKKWDDDNRRSNNNRYGGGNRNNNRNHQFNNSGRNNYNNNYNNVDRRDERSNNNFRQQFNALLNNYDPLSNNDDKNNNFNDRDNNIHLASFTDDNKNLIDLSPFGNQGSSSYSSLSSFPNDSSLSDSDLLFLNNLDNAPTGLPLYQAMVGGSDFKILIDSGASTCYVHPKLVSHAISVTNVKNQAVETADGKQSHINKKITFRMFLGNDHEYQDIVTAFVFESKFDIILGKDWLKRISPLPNWFEDTWSITHKDGITTTILHPFKQKQNNKYTHIIDTNNNLTLSNMELQSTQKKSQIDPSNSKLKLASSDTNHVDYLLSANQVSRLFKKKQITECYVVNFIDQETGNSALITPVDINSANQSNHDQEWKNEFAKLFPYAFKGEITELPPHRFTRDIIVTDPPNAPPIYHPPYRMSPLELEELKKQLSDLEKKGLIVPTASPYGFPVLFVRKASGQLRMCCDFRSLNKISISQRIPIPRIDECLDHLHKASHFSQLDLTGAFNQTRLSESDSMKATISHRFGQHRFLVTPFGLKNSGAYFQSILNAVLKEYIDKFCLVYLDDILIYSKSESEHKEHVKLILKKLDDAKFVINIDKSHFNINELTFLGFNISKNGILPSKKKTAAIRDWPVPSNVQQVRQFLGLAQHYRRFIPGFATIASPLTDLTSGTGYKTRAINWTPQCNDAFNLLKHKLCSAPVLSTPDMHKPFRIECDSSDFAAGAVLLQQDDNNIWKPLAYESKRYSKEERSYPCQEREMMAILIALRKWRCFIDGKKYTIYTDHLPLKYFREQSHPVPRLVRWMSEIELYNPDIQYKPGKDNVIPDLLSRRDGPDCIPAAESLKPKYLYNINNNSTTNQKSSLSKPVRTLADDLTQDWPLLYFRDEQNWPELLKKELQHNKSNFVIKDHHIYKLQKLPKSNEITELKFIPFHKRADCLDNFHNAFGHLSQLSIYQQMKNRVWWPDMHNDIISWLRYCPKCQLASRTEKNVHHAPMKPLDVPPAFARWHLDFIGELPLTKNNNKWLLVAVDYATNWVILRALPKASGDEIVKFIYEEIVLKFGNPVEIFTDRGQNFMSKVLKQYMNKIRSKHTFTSAYHPRSNSKCERTNQTVKNMLKKYVNGDVHSWDEYVDTVTFACRIRKHATTGHSPFFLVYGIHPRIPGDFHRPHMNEFTEFDANLITEDALTRIRQLREVRFLAEENMRNKAIKDKENWDKLLKGKETQIFKVNDYVLLRNEAKKGLEYNWMGPYQVINTNTDFNVYQIKEIEGKIYNSWVHTDRLKPIAINASNITSSWYIPRIAKAQ
jgi:hypothetical protein